MKVFVTGANGQLGYDLIRELLKRGADVLGSDIGPDSPSHFPYIQLDITDKSAVEKVICDTKPDVVIHCAAWTAVEAAQDDENKEKVYSINAGGTRYIAEACRKIDAKIIYISTDYVFGGDSDEPYKEDNKDFSPQNIYGESKLLGEKAVAEVMDKFFIVRISWVFGINGNNFIKTMLRIGKSHSVLKVVCDQIGSPTYTFDLARLLVDMAESERYGYYHATNEGEYISWYDFACEIFKEADYSTKVIPVTTEEYGISKAIRPKNSRLCKEKLAKSGFTPLPHWKDALSRYIKDLKDTQEI